MTVLKRKNPKNGQMLSSLGFGCMRFPMKNGFIDEMGTIGLIREAIDQGVNYLDTAYIYHMGKSEVILGRALKDGYRERVFLADKLPTFMVRSLDHGKKIFAQQLERMQVKTIEYYLLHMLTDLASFEKMSQMGIMEWLENLKAQKVIHNIGFSFHGGAEDFEKILQAYPWDFCQIQYNYLDENNQAGRGGLKLAAKLGLPVVIMEPLRGGRLVTHLPVEVKTLFLRENPQRSPAEWALRWLWDHPEVTVVLSGMNEFVQLAENIKVASLACPGHLTPSEHAMFGQVKGILQEKTKVPCTGCNYCMPCPHGVNIPGCFSSYNDKYLLQDKGARLRYFQTLGALSRQPAYASCCVACGACEAHCPQNIPIIAKLKEVSREMEGPFYGPVVRLARRLMGKNRPN